VPQRPAAGDGVGPHPEVGPGYAVRRPMARAATPS